ncbi:type II toxin-antitoxin system RelE family toxin [Ursidibacter sp. B-7004-1]
MNYQIEFIASAEKEFRKLSVDLRAQFIAKRAENPRVESAKLYGMKDCYKIKLKSSGYRLVYQVIDDRIVIKVIAVGKRERNNVYDKAQSRLN